MPKTQRIKLRRGTREALKNSTEILENGELVLINSSGNGYDSLVIGNGRTEAKGLDLIPLNHCSTGDEKITNLTDIL